jgi:hypothetical protein
VILRDHLKKVRDGANGIGKIKKFVPQVSSNRSSVLKKKLSPPARLVTPYNRASKPLSRINILLYPCSTKKEHAISPLIIFQKIVRTEFNHQAYSGYGTITYRVRSNK